MGCVAACWAVLKGLLSLHTYAALQDGDGSRLTFLETIYKAATESSVAAGAVSSHPHSHLYQPQVCLAMAVLVKTSLQIEAGALAHREAHTSLAAVTHTCAANHIMFTQRAFLQPSAV